MAWLFTLVALTSLTLGADGKPAVAIMSVDDVPAPTAFVESMRIQLSGMASVATGPLIGGRSRAEKAGQARQHLLTVGASIAVWEEHGIEAGSARERVVVIAVTREPQRPPIEVAEIATTGAPEEDRLLALKVGELLYQALAVASSEQELADQLASHGLKTDAVAVPPPSQPAPAPPVRIKLPRLASPAPWGVFVEAGGGLRVDSRFSAPQVTGSGALGVDYHGGRYAAELGVVGQLSTRREVPASNGKLQLTTRSVGATARLWVNAGPLAVGAHVEFSAAFVRAEATAADGRQGSATKVETSWSVGPEGRLRLAPRLEMRAALALQTTVYAQRFTIEGVPVVDRERHHEAADLSLIFRIP